MIDAAGHQADDEDPQHPGARSSPAAYRERLGDGRSPPPCLPGPRLSFGRCRPRLIDVIPPSGIPVGPLTIGFYGVGFVVAVVVMILVSQSEARRKGIDPGLVTSAIIVVAVFAIVGARLYHVIDEWHLYADDPLRAVLPPYAGLGLYGGILGATVGIWVFLRGRDIPLSGGLSTSSCPARSSPRASRAGATSSTRSSTDRRPTCPGAIAIDCAHRIAQYACSPDLSPRRRARYRARPASTRSSSTSRCSPSRAASSRCLLSPTLRRAPARRRPGLVLDDLVRQRAPRPRVLPRGLELDHPGVPTAMLIGVVAHHRRRGHHRLAPPDAAARGRLIGLPALAVAQGPTAAGRS